ncbi:MAG: nucleotide pyrophosphohydrolase [Gemmatimonadetes bacterium]|nr:nucleotide pyrophosphohydrolase [Gemmatimonadota bacterium]
MNGGRPPNLEELKHALRRFNSERDWSRYHGVKNLAMALASEVGELVAILRWKSSEESERANLDSSARVRIEQELGDVFLILMTLAERLDLDLLDVANAKLLQNAEKYPVATSRGRAEPSRE